jgi:LysR family hydrogen peroxide-inducible transcriptional activator
MSIKHLIDANSIIKKSILSEPGPHRELAIVVRQTYADIENVMLLMDIFRSELKKYSEDIQ